MKRVLITTSDEIDLPIDYGMLSMKKLIAALNS